MGIKIARFPFPLSVNEAYIPIPTKYGNRARMIASKKLLHYQSECQRFAFANRENFNKLKSAIKNWQSIAVKAEFYFPHKDVFTKDGKFQKFDVANFEKSMCDCLSKMIGVDDCHFNLLILEKKLTHETSQYLDVTIAEHKVIY